MIKEEGKPVSPWEKIAVRALLIPGIVFYGALACYFFGWLFK